MIRLIESGRDGMSLPEPLANPESARSARRENAAQSKKNRNEVSRVEKF
jgi:hypothetical protein